jgi:hypothetical protein
MKSKRSILKQQLADKLIERKLFWSYSSVRSDDIPEEVLIEKSLIHLDIEDIDNLFLVFPWKKIKEVWMKEVLIQEPFYHSMNILLAFLYFHIRKPESYIARYINSLHLS